MSTNNPSHAGLGSRLPDTPQPKAADPRVHELRDQLRSLGYLDAGVDRFVLAPAQSARSPLAVALRSGVRVGALAGALLGPCAAIGVAARLPGLVSGVRDATVLAIYLAALFLVAFATLSVVISLGAAAFVRTREQKFTTNARRVSRGAGWLVAIGCVAYLTLWWRMANAGLVWSAPVWTTLALAVGIIVSFLIGHGVQLATLGVLAAAAGPAKALPPVSIRSWRFTLAGGAIAFAGAVMLLIWTTPTDATEAGLHPPLTVVPTGQRVIVIAIDGFDRDAFREVGPGDGALSAAFNVLPVRPLRPQGTLDPAAAWTTIATGVRPEEHGVHGLETRRVAGVRGIITASYGPAARVVAAATDLIRLTRPSVASSMERRAKTMWEVAAEAGLRTAVVNWWATWPAPSKSGAVLTDRALVRLERGGPLDAEIAPPELYPILKGAWPALRQRAHDAALRAFQEVPNSEVADVLRRSAELDHMVVDLLKALPGPSRDMDVVYLPGLDIVQHQLFGSDDGSSLSASAVSTRLSGLRAYYRFLDGIVAEAGAPRQPITASAANAGSFPSVIIVMQPGRVQNRTGGFMAMWRPGMHLDSAGRQQPQQADVLDVMPTVMAALGLPLSRELPGHPLEPLSTPNAAQMKLRYVRSYGPPSVATAPREGQPLDQEMIDRLRSLGYVK